MLLKNTGFPEESEIVLCVVTSVQSHSVFVKIDEYGLSGMIHISEVSPGRIRNMRDFVKEGKTIVCKVLRVNKERGQVDLSLRRVTEMQRKNKVNEVKQEQKAEKIIEHVATKLKLDMPTLYNELSSKITAKYDSIFDCFSSIVESQASLEGLGVKPDIAKELTEAVIQRIKPAEVEIRGILQLTTYSPEGINIIKAALQKAIMPGVTVSYAGAGRYNIFVKAADYKAAEQIIKQAGEAPVSYIISQGGEGTFERSGK